MTSPRGALRALALVLLLAGVARPDDLAAAVGAALDRAPKVTIGAQVVDEATGAVVFAREAARPLTPASTLKLLTTGAALAVLGPDHAFETRVVAAAGPRAGVLDGPVFVVGDGDPTIARRFEQDPLLADWAEALWRAGVRRIRGDLVADDRAFTGPRLHPGWTAGDAERWYGAEVSALVLNDGCVDVRVAGAPDRPRVTLEPASGWLALEVAARATPDRKRHVFAIDRAGPERRTLRVTGQVWSKAGGQEVSVPAPDPALWFVWVLAERLRARGIELEGAPRRAAPDEAAPGLTLHRRPGALRAALLVTNQRSQNLYAECLARAVGRRARGDGSWEAACAAIRAWARSAGAEEAEVENLDGSGLCRDSRVSPRALVAALRAAGAGPHGALFRESLAAPGEEGTLRGRLRGLPAGVRVRAKTGTLRGVAALAGFVEGPGGRFAFAFLGNGGDGGRAAIDAAVVALARAAASGT